MIQGIEIENFRLFHKTEINGFGLVNLLGGKNNSGKTSLLEAIYVAFKGSVNDVMAMRQYNYKDDQDSKEAIFYNQDVYNFAKISLAVNGAQFHTIIQSNQKTISVSTETDNKDYDAFEKAKNGNDFWLDNEQSFILSKDLQYPKTLNLSEEYDRIDILGESETILKSIQLIDDSISEVRTYATRPNILYLRRKNEKIALPLVYSGDAVQKIMRYFITIVRFNSKANLKCLLIDEIENGLHYTVQKEFWTMLFKLAIENNVQIFATTHSGEMIEAVAGVAEKPEFVGKGLFFEMFRHFKTNEIVANKFNVNTLEYYLHNNLSLRGE